MSIVVPRGLLSHPLRYADICTGCLARQARHTVRVQRPSVTLPASSRRNVHRWRQQAVADLNDKNAGVIVKEDSAPGRKDGILRPEHYSNEPSFMPINLEPLPKLAEGDPEQGKTLDATRPPSFVAAKRNPEDSTFTYLFRVGRTYWTFYKTGIKNLWENRKEVKDLRGWIQPFSLPGVARYGGNMHKSKQGNEIPIPYIHRREFQLYHRTRADLRKLVPFSLLLLVCGEFTPIALLVLGRRVVPRVCYLPFQQREEMDDTVKRFKRWRDEMKKLTAQSITLTPRHRFDFTPKEGRLEHPWRRDLLFAYMVGQTNFYRLPFPITRGLYWHFVLMPRLNRYWDQIFCDTILIQRQGGFKTMSPQDIYEYARNYGLLTLLVIMEREVGKKNYEFVNESLKAKLLPILEKEAIIMLNDDFTKLTPNLHWARAYRDSARWWHSPDVEAAAELLRRFEHLDAQSAATAKTSEQKPRSGRKR